MVDTQIFGWTEPKQPPAGQYVKFLMAFRHEDGSFKISVRNREGITNDIDVPVDQAKEMARKILEL